MGSKLSLTGVGNAGASIVSQILTLNPVIWLRASDPSSFISQGALTFDLLEEQYLEADTAAVTAYPFTLAAWFKTSNNTVQQTMVFVGHKGSDGNHVYIVKNINGFVKAVSSNTTNGISDAVTILSTYDDGAWHLAVGVFESASSRIIYIDGEDGVLNTEPNEIEEVFDRTSLGRNGDSTADKFFDGDLGQSGIWNSILTAAQVTALYNGGTMIDFATVLTPTAHWFLNGRSRVKWEDRIGGLDMVAAGGTGQPELVTGLRNDGAAFVAANTQRLEIGIAAVTAYPFTLACWFKTTTASGQTLIWIGDKDATDVMAYLNLSSGSKVQAVSESNADGIDVASSAASTYDDGNWHLGVAVFINDISRKVYVDDASAVENTANNTIVGVFDRTTLGRVAEFTPRNYFDGTLDEAMVWTSALSDADVVTLYNSGIPLSLQQVQSLVAPPQNYWSLDTHSPYLDAVGTLDLTPFGDKLLPVSAAGPDELQAVEGSAIEQWLDQGLDGNDVSQATVIERPQLVRVPWANEQGYMSAVRFDGVDDVMSVTLGSPVSQPFETFSIVRFISPRSGVNEYVWADDTHPHFRKHSDNTISAHAGGTLLQGSVATRNWELFNMEINGGSTTIIRNGVTDATGGTGTTAHTDVFLGSRNADSDDPGFFEILEHLVFPSGLLSAASKSLVLTHLRDNHNLHWGDSVATGPALWLSASSNGIKTANDGSGNDVADAETIGFWPDLSGNVHNAIQAVGLFRPAWDATNSSFNAKPVVSFDGVNDALSILDPADMDNGVGLTIGFVANLTAAAADHYLIEKAGTYSLWIDSDGEVHFAIGTDSDAYATVIADLDADITAGTPFIIVIQYVTTAIKLYVNGVQKGSTVTTVNGDVLDTTADVIIGASSAAGADPWAGEIADAIVFNRGISDDEINAHFKPIASFYSTPWTDI